MFSQLRVKLSRKLTPRFKSQIRKLLFRSGFLNRKLVERIVFDAVRLDGADYFLQIGANDGQYADPLNLAVNSTPLRGVLVEPHPQYFAKLMDTYRSTGGLKFVNAGVSDGEGQLILYTFDADDKSIPAWLHGSSSFSRDEVVSRARRVKGAEQRIREIVVPLVSVDALLAQCERIPSIIVVDAEGFDAVILRQFNFGLLQPALVIYESEAMTLQDAADIKRIFEENSYEVVCLGQDTVAINSSSKMLPSMLKTHDKKGRRLAT